MTGGKPRGPVGTPPLRGIVRHRDPLRRCRIHGAQGRTMLDLTQMDNPFTRKLKPRQSSPPECVPCFATARCFTNGIARCARSASRRSARGSPGRCSRLSRARRSAQCVAEQPDALQPPQARRLRSISRGCVAHHPGCAAVRRARRDSRVRGDPLVGRRWRGPLLGGQSARAGNRARRSLSGASAPTETTDGAASRCPSPCTGLSSELVDPSDPRQHVDVLRELGTKFSKARLKLIGLFVV